MEGEARATVSPYDTGKRIKGKGRHKVVAERKRERERVRIARVRARVCGSCQRYRGFTTVTERIHLFHLHLLSTLMLPSSSTPSHPCTERPLFHRSAVPPGQTSSKIKVDRPLKNEGTPVGEHTVYIFIVAAGFPFELRS